MTCIARVKSRHPLCCMHPCPLASSPGFHNDSVELHKASSGSAERRCWYPCPTDIVESLQRWLFGPCKSHQIHPGDLCGGQRKKGNSGSGRTISLRFKCLFPTLHDGKQDGAPLYGVWPSRCTNPATDRSDSFLGLRSAPPAWIGHSGPDTPGCSCNLIPCIKCTVPLPGEN